jgi:hypothetical protein
MDGTMGERDVRGEVGELCGSGVERKEAGARGKKPCGGGRAARQSHVSYVPGFVLLFILFRVEII